MRFRGLSTFQRKLIKDISSEQMERSWEEEYCKKTTLKQKLLTYSWFSKLSMGETLEYLAGHFVVIGYKELMVDRLSRWHERTSDSE